MTLLSFLRLSLSEIPISLGIAWNSRAAAILAFGWLLRQTRASFRGLHGILSCFYECTVRNYAETRLSNLPLRSVAVIPSLKSQAKSTLHAFFSNLMLALAALSSLVFMWRSSFSLSWREAVNLPNSVERLFSSIMEDSDIWMSTSIALISRGLARFILLKRCWPSFFVRFNCTSIRHVVSLVSWFFMGLFCRSIFFFYQVASEHWFWDAKFCLLFGAALSLLP